MAYLVKNDYTLRIPLSHLDEILAEATDDNSGSITPDQVREDAEQTAIAEVQSYLAGRYIIENEYLKEGTADPDTRNKIVMKCTMDIALYNIHHAINPRDIPELREKNYNHCIEVLEGYRDGNLIFIAPPTDPNGIEPRPVEDGGSRRIVLQSHRKFISKPFTDPLIYEEYDEDNPTP